MANPLAQSPRRVYLIDDHPIVRRGLASLLERDPLLVVVGQAANGDEAVRGARAANADLVIMDLGLPGPGLSGLDLLQRLHGENPDLIILVYSMKDEQTYAERAIRIGASGFLMKDEPPERFLEAVNRVLGGDLYLSKALERTMIRDKLRAGRGDGESTVHALSDRELMIFEMYGQGLTTQQIAGRLYISKKTVDTHRAHIKAKLKFASNNEMVSRASEWLRGDQGTHDSAMVPSDPPPT